jgi:citrate lyase subunit beta/citryl-CoA lyase
MVSNLRLSRFLRRSILFVPANSQRMSEKASKLPADMIILDCEDSVPEKEKLTARSFASESLRRYNWGLKEVGIRINGFDSSLWLDDLKSAVEASADFVVVPKVEDPSEIKRVEEVIRHSLGMTKSVNKGNQEELKVPKIVVAIENAQGVVNAKEILLSSKLITAVEFGAEDYALSLGILSTERSIESSLYARSHVVALARAYSIDPLDQAFVGLNDVEGLRASAREAKNLGFTGKCVIHPNQIEIVNEIFSPSATEITWASKILDAWKIAEEQGRAAFRLDDKMVDIVHVKMAQRILRTAQQLGLEFSISEHKELLH